MPISEKTHSVYLDIRKNRNGFTFVSVLAMIGMVFMTIPFAAYLMQAIDYESSYDPLAVNQFFLFLRDETVESVDVSISPSKLTFTLQDESSSTIEQYGDMVIRRVEDTGFEVFLREIQDVQFEAVKYGFEVTITMLNGDQYAKTIVHYD